MANILEVESIEHSYKGEAILKSIYLKAEKGKVTGILGSNGCGKSTLLRIVFGELQPQNRMIRINKKPILRKLYETQIVKYLPQFNIFPNTNTINYFFNLFNVSDTIFLNVFPEFKDSMDKRFSTLSGGEKRVIEIYIILKCQSEIILLDEPFSNLSPLNIEKIKKIIQIEKKEKIIILTDHFYQDILEVSKSIYLLKDGWIKEIKNNDELIFNQYVNSL